MNDGEWPESRYRGGEVQSGGVEVVVFLTSWAHIYIESSHGVFPPLEVAGAAQALVDCTLPGPRRSWYRLRKEGIQK